MCLFFFFFFFCFFFFLLFLSSQMKYCVNSRLFWAIGIFLLFIFGFALSYLLTIQYVLEVVRMRFLCYAQKKTADRNCLWWWKVNGSLLRFASTKNIINDRNERSKKKKKTMGKSHYRWLIFGRFLSFLLFLFYVLSS